MPHSRGGESLVVTNVFNIAPAALLMLAADVDLVGAVKKMYCCPTSQARMRILTIGHIQTRTG